MSGGHFTILVFARLRALKGEGGITLVEGLIAMTLFLVVATGLVGVLTAGIASHRYARENTFAQQKAMEQIELARRLTYDKVGIASGNPPGDLQATTPLTLNGLKATMTTQVSFVDDAVPGSYATLANYKKVVVTVTRDGNSKVLTRQVTYIAPVNRAPYGGINNAIVNVLVTDEALNTPVPSVTVWLTNGPSTDRSDTTDAAGRVSFPSLLTGSQKYKITVPSSSGYETLTEYQPPNAAAEFALSASQTKDAALRIYKKHVVNVTVEDSSGNPYTSALTLYAGSDRRGEAIPITGPTYTLQKLAGEWLVPGVSYSFAARTASGLFSATVPAGQLPVGYPGNLSSDVVLQLSSGTFSTLNATVTVTDSSGTKLANARVDITSGPVPTYVTGVTASNGTVTLAVPLGNGYTITAWDSSGLRKSTPLTNQNISSNQNFSVTVN